MMNYINQRIVNSGASVIPENHMWVANSSEQLENQHTKEMNIQSLYWSDEDTRQAGQRPGGPFLPEKWGSSPAACPYRQGSVLFLLWWFYLLLHEKGAVENA